MKMGKKGGNSTNQTMLWVLLIVGVGAAALWAGSNGVFSGNTGGQQVSIDGQQLAVSGETPASTDNGGVTLKDVIDSNACTGDPAPTMRFIAYNPTDKQTTYYTSSKIFVVPEGGDLSKRFSLITVGATTTATEVQETTKTACGLKYDVVAVVNRSTTNGAYLKDYTDRQGGVANFAAVPNANNLYELPVSNFSNVKCRVYDEELRAYVWSADDSRTGVSTASGYNNLGATNFYQSTTNASNKTINGDENTKFYYTFDCLTINAYSAFGITTGIAVDAQNDSNTNDWDLDNAIVKVGGPAGTTLGNIKSSLSSKDQQGVANFQRVYNLGKPITGVDQTFVTVKLPTGGGQNPAVTVQFKFVGSEVAESSVASGTFLGLEQFSGGVPRYFSDAATPTELATSTDNSILIPTS